MSIKKILLISSDEKYQQELNEINNFQSAKYDYSSVPSLAEAMDYLDKNTVALIVLDTEGSYNNELINKLLRYELPLIVSSKFESQLYATDILNNAADNFIFRDKDKNYLKIIQKIFDITISNRIEDKSLEETENKYKEIYENNIVMYFTLDSDNRIVSANTYAFESLGYSGPEIVGKLFTDLVSEEDRITITDQIELCKKHPGINFQWEFRLIRKDESTIWVKDYAHTMKSSDPAALLISCEDISVRKHAEESLIEWKNRYETAVEATSQILFDWDMETNKITFGGQLFEGLGYDSSQLPSDFDEFTDLIHKDDCDAFKNAVPKIKNSEKPFYISFRLKDKEGNYIYVESNMRFISSPSDKKGRIIGFIEDITLKRKIEDEMIKSQKLESLGTLAGGIANDFNNLLTGILGNISLIKRYITKDDKINEKLTEIENASLRAKDLTQNLFVFSTGGSPVKSRLKPADIIKESLDFALKGANLEKEINVEDDLSDIFADREQILQVANNILVNADQSMKEGGKISLFLNNVHLGGDSDIPLPQGKYVKISIVDEGCGISEEYLKKIFDPYFTTKKTGSGLGLSTAHSIISNHDGYIDVTSSLGVGTRVDIYLPVYTEWPGEKGKKEVAGDDTAMLSGKRILVMDDEDLIRRVAGNILQHLNCEVDFAAEGNEAVEIYKREFDNNNTYDFVILDLTVREGVGGLECVRRLLEIDPEVKAIVSSGYSKDPAITNYRDYGFIGVINKPYEIEDFIKSFRDAIG